MSKPEEPLNEVSLNTPARRQAFDPLSTTLGSSFVKSGNENALRFDFKRAHISSKYISHHHEFISQALKQKGSLTSQIDLISQSLDELYRIFIRLHSWENLRMLTKRHLTVVVGLLSEGDITTAVKEILHVHNGASFHKVYDLHGILLADCTSSNQHYLHSLKLLALQAILKGKMAQEYQQTIVRLFALDHRYLLQMENLKVHMVVQLLLNFFSVLPNLKVLFGLKFLQYLKQFNLRFETYIVNMNRSSFLRQLRRRAVQMVPECEYYLRCYYDQYSLHDTTPEKLMYCELKEERSTVNFSIHNAMKEGPANQLCKLRDNLTQVMDAMVEFINGDKEQVTEYLKLFATTWETIRYDGMRESNRKKAFFDKTLLLVNSEMSMVKENDSYFFNLLSVMAEYCIDSNQSKRLVNVINVLFNCFVVSKKINFLKIAAKFESERHLSGGTKLSRAFIEKFEKFLSRASEQQDRLFIFRYLFNFQILGCETLGTIQTFCQNVYVRCQSKLRLTKFVDFDFCSEVMMAFFYGYSSINDVPLDLWSPVTRMLYSCLSGTFLINTIEINPEPNKWHFLYRYEVLIKAAYCFNIEMSKHSMLNLASIVKNYMKKWIDSRPSESKEKASPFEMDFLKILLQYLAFNGFDKLSIDLLTCLQSHTLAYDQILPELQAYRLSAYVNLQMPGDIISFKDEIVQRAFDLKTAKLERLLQFLEEKLQIITWERDFEGFDSLFIQELPKVRPEVLDINNNFGKSASQYIKVILFNVNLLITASTLQLLKNDLLAAVTESRKALKLALSLLKKSNKISEGSRLKVVGSLASSYLRLVSLFTHAGIARDSDFYANELSTVICELSEPSIVFKCLQFLHHYYMLSGQNEMATTALRKSNETFEYIDGECNIVALASFFFINREYDKLLDALRLFFMEDYEKTCLPIYWRLKMGQVVEDLPVAFQYKILNETNKMKFTYQCVMSQLDKDPFFKSMFDSMAIIPSCHLPNKSFTEQATLNATENSSLTASPRSSTMTPKDRHIRKKFDRAAAINNLKILKKSAENLELSSLKNHELSTLSSFYSLALSLLSNLTIGNSVIDCLAYEFALSDLSKFMPLYYDKALTSIGSEIYRNFNLLPVISQKDPVQLQREKCLEEQKRIHNSCTSFSVVSIDYCPVTKSLLLSKFETSHKRKVHIRMPLNRAHSRDLDCATLSFEDARKELLQIIEESNASTSSDVTSSITTREQRKRWWQTRYELDRRLQELLECIEVTWFNGMKGFFSPEIIEPRMLQDFKSKVNDILHQNLPSRRQSGNPGRFMQIDDWILELVLKLNPQSDEFVSMMEDLIFVILDILLYHGEENAFDEVDVGIIHVQLEETLRKFRPRLQSAPKISHTFLVVSSDCHMFPWESFSFLKDISVTRVPSFSLLNDLIANSNNEISPKVSLNNNIAMILNPHGDLSKTESRFSTRFRKISQEKPNCSLLVNQKPDEKTFLDMISSSNLFIYLGHGGGEQYARTKEIKKYSHIAPSFLLGCSSASMGLYGKLEPTGTVYSYLLGGCCSVLGNLWDVTDKDIDKFSERVFDQIGLGCEPSVESPEGSWISKAVSSSRDVCHLKYLNGAAPVLYGLPIRFR